MCLQITLENFLDMSTAILGHISGSSTDVSMAAVNEPQRELSLLDILKYCCFCIIVDDVIRSAK